MGKENLYVMSDEEYKKLNSYLNEVFNFLSKEDNFLIENIVAIAKMNEYFLSFMSNYELLDETKINNLTYDQVFSLAREIIASIDSNYLEKFDKLLDSGKLEFNYEDESDSYHDNGLINIGRSFNYIDVVKLIHEFMHLTNASSKETQNRHLLTEFLSIYFEMYAIDYLLKRGVSKEEIGVFERLLMSWVSSEMLSEISIVFLAFEKFGDIHKNTFSDLNEYFLSIPRLEFVRECKLLLLDFLNMENDYRNEIMFEKQFNMKEFVGGLPLYRGYLYVLGTILAFYARSNCKLEDIVFLNNHINDANIGNANIKDVLNRIGIDITSPEFMENAFQSIDSYIEEYSDEKQR